MFFGWIILFSYLIGVLGKMIIFNHMTNFNIKQRPINVLIMVDELIYATTITFMAFNLCIVLIGQQTPYQFFFTYFGIEMDEVIS